MIFRGLLVGILFSGTVCFGQGDPFAMRDSEKKKEEAHDSINLVFEVFSLPASEAAKVIREASGDEELYETLVTGLEGELIEQEVFQSVVSRSGEEVAIRDGEDFTHPARSRPAFGVLYPQSLEAYERIFVHPMPTYQINKRLGWSVLLTPRLDRKKGGIEVSVSASKATLSRLEKWGMSPVEKMVPNFSVAELRTIVTVSSGQVCLLGSMRDGGASGGVGRVRLAFLRARLEGETVKESSSAQTRLVYEVFALPVRESARLRRATKSNDLYRAVIAASKEGEQEEVIVWSGAMGGGVIAQREEIAYPSEYDPDALQRPQWDQRDQNLARRTFAHDYPSFETRNLGVTLNIGGKWLNDSEYALSLKATHIDFLQRLAWGEGKAKFEFPEPGLRSLKSSTTLPAGTATLVGTVNRPDQPELVRWVFVTVWKNK